MPRIALIVFSLGCVLMSCRSGMKNESLVRDDLLEYLTTKVGLDTKSLDINVTKVTFVDNEAHATVSFHEKNNPSIQSGMVMQYTLEPKGNHWVVTKRADSQGHGLGAAGPADQSLPPGHPPLQSMPPGHPPIQKMQSDQTGEPQGRTQ